MMVIIMQSWYQEYTHIYTQFYYVALHHSLSAIEASHGVHHNRP